jgi:hypothetical protein
MGKRRRAENEEKQGLEREEPGTTRLERKQIWSSPSPRRNKVKYTIPNAYIVFTVVPVF